LFVSHPRSLLRRGFSVHHRGDHTKKERLDEKKGVTPTMCGPWKFSGETLTPGYRLGGYGGSPFKIQGLPAPLKDAEITGGEKFKAFFSLKGRPPILKGQKNWAQIEAVF